MRIIAQDKSTKKGLQQLIGAQAIRIEALELALQKARGCTHCPHCIGSGAAGFPIIDPSDPALTTNQPPKKSKAKRCRCGHVAGAHAKKAGDCWAGARSPRPASSCLVAR